MLLGLYHPAQLTGSLLGLVWTAIHHAVVWVPYACTERPDLRTIYGERDAPPSEGAA